MEREQRERERKREGEREREPSSQARLVSTNPPMIEGLSSCYTFKRKGNHPNT